MACESNQIYTGMDSGIKLLLTIYLGYVVAYVYHRYVYKYAPDVQYAYFIGTSFLLYMWNFGFDIKHPIATIVLQWTMLKLFGGCPTSLKMTFALQLGYYLLGIRLQSPCAHGNYQLNWLTPQCVLLLRMVGLAFDMYDGHKAPSQLENYQKESAFYGPPPLLEMFAFAFFPGGFLIGPQFSLVRFRKLVRGQLVEQGDDCENTDRYVEAGKRFVMGTAVLLVQRELSFFFNPSYYISYDFEFYPFDAKLVYVCITGHLTIIKYLAIWTVNDGVNVISGLGYGSGNLGNEWNSVSNGNMIEFAKCSRFQHLIKCYNINTNAWVLKYIHKRLKFMGSRAISHFGSLAFLALWHGFHVGYYTAFGFQFLVMNAERAFVDFASEYRPLQKLLDASQHRELIQWVVGFTYMRIFMGYCMIDFSLLHFDVYAPVYYSLYYYGHIFFILLLPASKLMKASLPASDSETEPST